MVHFYKTLFPMLKVQPTTDEATESLTLTGYEVLHRRYLEQRQFVPESHLIEVGFGDLERDPMGVARRIYRHFGISGFGEAEASLQEYIDSVNSYQRNPFELPADAMAAVNDRWGFAFDEWGYRRQEAASQSAHLREPADIG